MFKGKAELVDPERNSPVATFTEECQDDGTAKMKVVLKTPIVLSGTERLAIYSTIKNQEVISATRIGETTDPSYGIRGGQLAWLPCRQLRHHPNAQPRRSFGDIAGRVGQGDDPRGALLIEQARLLRIDGRGGTGRFESGVGKVGWSGCAVAASACLNGLRWASLQAACGRGRVHCSHYRPRTSGTRSIRPCFPMAPKRTRRRRMV